jgi:antitoxin ParD1/3/4
MGTVRVKRKAGIRRDNERVEREAFDRLKAELQHAFSAPDAFYHSL